MLVEVRRQMVARWPHEDPDLIEMAVDDALLKIARRPDLYDPSRGHPAALIKKMALRSLIDLRRSRLRRLVHEVTSGLDIANASAAVVGPEFAAIEHADRLVEQEGLLMSVAEIDFERAFVREWLAGGPTTELARILELAATSPVAQRTVVHATKMRLRKRARLAAARSSSVGLRQS